MELCKIANAEIKPDFAGQILDDKSQKLINLVTLGQQMYIYLHLAITKYISFKIAYRILRCQ